MLVTELRHYLDVHGELAPMPLPALNLALFQGAIVAWMTSRSSSGSERTNVHCRHAQRGEGCLEEIVAVLEEEDQAIAWRCPGCGDDGIIRGWEGTSWDRREPRERN
jgi:hypothetical protein